MTNYTGIPLTFMQETQVEQYLYARQELEGNPDNTEVREATVTLLKTLQTFLTAEKIEELEQYIQPVEEPKYLTLDILLPAGWDPDDYQTQVLDKLVNIKNHQIQLTLGISYKPQSEWEREKK